MARARRGRRRDGPRRAGSARCTGCRSRTRTWRSPRASAPRSGRRSSPTSCPTEDDLIVERLRAAGAVTHRQDQHARVRRRLADVQPGVRCDPQPVRPRRRTCGGSSGGAAVGARDRHDPDRRRQRHGRVAAQPGQRSATSSGCGRRPGACRRGRRRHRLGALSADGPMARTVGDLALLLSALAGPDPRVPISLPEPGSVFRRRSTSTSRARGVAWAPDLGLPVDPAVARCARASVPDGFEALGLQRRRGIPTCAVPRDLPDAAGAGIRAVGGRALRPAPGSVKDTVRGTSRRPRLSARDARPGRAAAHRAAAPRVRGVLRALRRARAAGRRRCRRSTSSSTGPIEVDGVRDADVHRLDAHRAASSRSRAARRSRCRPAFTPEGLPVGLQLVGRPRRRRSGCCALAHAFERARFG